MTSVETYIKSNWAKTIRTADGSDGMIPLPKPFTSPCADQTFTSMFYWDTYFTNVGLILSDMTQQAKYNAQNMFYLISQYGKMLNYNGLLSLNRSQPPFLSQMVREIYEQSNDRRWLADEAYPALKTEYRYWQNERITETGLNRYTGYVYDMKAIDNYCGILHQRTGLPIPESMAEKLKFATATLAVWESGWDCTSRFANMDIQLHNPVDLNSLMYLLEMNMARFARELSLADDALDWEKRAGVRKERMNALLWHDDGYFADYQFETGKKSDIFSAAAFYPLFAGLATDDQARETVKKLDRLEMEFGIAACENREDLLHLQWDYPNGWACLQFIVIRALLNYGYREDALRIAGKYLRTVEYNFEKTGNLWEKYNVVTGEVAYNKEYPTPPMMGWSAGIYLYCRTLL